MLTLNTVNVIDYENFAVRAGANVMLSVSQMDTNNKTEIEHFILPQK